MTSAWLPGVWRWVSGTVWGSSNTMDRCSPLVWLYLFSTVFFLIKPFLTFHRFLWLFLFHSFVSFFLVNLQVKFFSSEVSSPSSNSLEDIFYIFSIIFSHEIWPRSRTLRLCSSTSLFRFVCQENWAKTTERISTKLGQGIFLNHIFEHCAIWLFFWHLDWFSLGIIHGASGFKCGIMRTLLGSTEWHSCIIIFTLQWF